MTDDCLPDIALSSITVDGGLLRTNHQLQMLKDKPPSVSRVVNVLISPTLLLVSLASSSVVLRLARLNDEADYDTGETSDNVPNPQPDSGDYYAYYGYQSFYQYDQVTKTMSNNIGDSSKPIIFSDTKYELALIQNSKPCYSHLMT
ncbi:unnamed protein product [Protopolystoma xenopodis]|uniref:Uncharacterized protein n=1 Tax=Protopolystoma xenopodis TaxID=117903 RepID=A0A3S5A5H6_9PLAT|nr:unnamed protein product [Protopolystoma xenopodis]